MKNRKSDRFVRLAEARINKVLKMLRLLSNLSNKSVYEYTDADVKKIFDAVEKEVKDARSRFNEEPGGKFTLS